MGARQLRLVVAAEDYDEALAFYRDVLGLPQQEAYEGGNGARVAILDAGRATLEIANPAQRRLIDEVEVGRQVAPRLRVAFEVDDTRARTAELVAAGAEQVAPPTVTPWGSLNSRLAAPAGLQITLFQELAVPPPADAPGPAAGGPALVDARPADGPEDRAGGSAGEAPGTAAGEVVVRAATGEDWAGIWPFLHRIVADGETYCWDRDISEQRARAAWLREPPGRTVVAVDSVTGTVLGTAETHPNQAGAGAHVANAGFMVDPGHGGRGVGRRLAEHVLAQAEADGYRAMQFNAVVETNTGALALWRSLGFSVVGTVPAAFDHPTHGPVALLVLHRLLGRPNPLE